MKDIKANANQKIVTVNKVACNEENLYAKINKEVLFEAMRILKPLELKVFLYIASNQDCYRFALSSEHIYKSVNSNKRKIQEAINGLVEKGILIRKNESCNEYIFAEDILLCPKRTQGYVQKGHRGMSKKDIEI